MSNNNKERAIAFVKKLVRDLDGRGLFFRGTGKKFPTVRSSLHRLADRRECLTFHRSLDGKYVERVRKYFPAGISNAGILSDLQHCYRCTTNLVDFTTNPRIALYYACEDLDDNNKGEILYFDHSDMEEMLDVDYEELKASDKPFYVRPVDATTSEERVIAQSSILVCPPSGKIEKRFFKSKSIPAEFKKHIMDHLRDEEDVHDDTVMVDTYWFTENQIVVAITEEISISLDELCESNPKSSYNHKWYGVLCMLKGLRLEGVDFSKPNEANPKNIVKAFEWLDKSILYLNKAVEINPKFASTFLELGHAYTSIIADTERAKPYFQKAIELAPSYAKPYTALGDIERMLGRRENAIAYYDKAIELRNDYVEAYSNRGFAKFGLCIANNYNRDWLIKAIVDYDNVIELDKYNVNAYRNRSPLKFFLGKSRDADEDYQMAEKLEAILLSHSNAE